MSTIKHKTAIQFLSVICWCKTLLTSVIQSAPIRNYTTGVGWKLGSPLKWYVSRFIRGIWTFLSPRRIIIFFPFDSPLSPLYIARYVLRSGEVYIEGRKGERPGKGPPGGQKIATPVLTARLKVFDSPTTAGHSTKLQAQRGAQPEVTCKNTLFCEAVQVFEPPGARGCKEFAFGECYGTDGSVKGVGKGEGEGCNYMHWIDNVCLPWKLE